MSKIAPTRRTVLERSAAIALSTFVGETPLLAAEPGSPATGAQKPWLPIICLEEHINDPAIAQATMPAFAEQLPYFGGLGSRYREDPADYGTSRPSLTFVPESIRTASAPLSERMAAMDAAGIDMQVLSLSNAAQLAPAAQAGDLIRASNDRLAEAAVRHPGRFSGFFALPWQDPAAAVHEAERCVRDLRLPGTLIAGRPDGDSFLDDPRFDEVLGRLAQLDAPIYIHPGAPLAQVQQRYYGGFNAEINARLPLFGWGWHHEAGIQVIRLILSGSLDRHRNLKIISGHWGEMVPFYLQRMDDTMPPQATGLSRTISQTYREQVWVGPSGMLDLPHFLFVREVVGIDQLVFSIDYPYLTLNGARAWLETLPIADEEKQAFAWRNASRLLSLPVPTHAAGSSRS
jgi:predicted TIM-barrel fold metal-dependent hydrolase